MVHELKSLWYTAKQVSISSSFIGSFFVQIYNTFFLHTRFDIIVPGNSKIAQNNGECPKSNLSNVIPLNFSVTVGELASSRYKSFVPTCWWNWLLDNRLTHLLLSWNRFNVGLVIFLWNSSPNVVWGVSALNVTESPKRRDDFETSDNKFDWRNKNKPLNLISKRGLSSTGRSSTRKRGITTTGGE